MFQIAEKFPHNSIRRIFRPFQEFTKLAASGGILLLLFTVVALIWANSPYGSGYFKLWQTELSISFGFLTLSKPLILWINEGLMAVFFFVVGLEIKREFLVGELASPRQAALPMAGALGGMLVPAALYVFFNLGTDGVRGWGIPMATDIAFAIGVLSILGKRIPLSIKVFLTALAIVDDIGAVLVIAVFYTKEISWLSLAIGAGFLLALIILNLSRVRHPLAYLLFGFGLWMAFLKSGVHATVAGVLSAMTIPARSKISTDAFVAQSREMLMVFGRAARTPENAPNSAVQQAALHSLESACERLETPMQRLEHSLHPWVIYLIMPLFALANAGVMLAEDIPRSLVSPVSLGIVLGLVIGKPIGITLFSWLAITLGLAEFGRGGRWKHLVGAGCLGGIGFTMSLFIAGLAFGNTPSLSTAKVGILVASVIAGITGWLILMGSNRRNSSSEQVIVNGEDNR